MNASDRPKREGDKRVGEGSESKGVGVVSIIILVSVFSIIILTSFSYRERLPNLVNAS